MYVEKSDVQIFGLTATTPQIPSAIKVRNKIKELRPDAQVILGGPHATLTYAAKMHDEKLARFGRGTFAFAQLQELFDKIVVGDGEKAVFVALDDETKEQIVDADGLRSPLFIKRGELDSFPFPARDLIDLDSYHYTVDGLRAFSVIAQLGCPFECGFCGGRDSQSYRLARTRGVENIIDEIELVVRKSIEGGNPFRAVMFYDDELNVVPKNLENLCIALIDLQDRLGMEMRFRGFVKSELFTKEQARFMYQAGFRIILSGIESGSNKMLAAMRKRATTDINSRCVELTRDAGLKFKALMSLGHPGESEDTVAESVEWVLKSNPDDVDWTIITQYPGSPYYDHSIYVPEKNVWLYKEPKSGANLWSRNVDFTKHAEYYKGIPGSYVAYVWTDFLTSEKLVQLRDHAETLTRDRLGLGPIIATPAVQLKHNGCNSLPSNVLRESIRANI